MAETTPPIHLRLRGSLHQATERLALRAALAASHLLGLATGTHLRHLRGLADPLARLQARREESELRARLAWETAELFALFALSDAWARGKKLESVLSRLFKASDILVREAFSLKGDQSQGVVEQIDGVWKSTAISTSSR